MANQNKFTSTNPFANTKKVRRSSITKAPPKPPSLPPNTPNGASDHMRRQLLQYQNMYKQTKNQLEVLKSQYKGIGKELNIYKSQKQAIDTNHSNILLWQKKMATLESEKQTLIDKNGLFLQQKNTYLLQLADVQEDYDELKIQIDNKTIEVNKLENELLNSTQNYTQQLSKQDNKYKNLKNEYNSLNKEYIALKQKNNSMYDELNTINTQFKDISQENLLIKDKYNKLQTEYHTVKTDRDQLQQEICQVKGDSSMAVKLSQKKDQNIIKDLRHTLKTETMKSQQFRAEYLQLKDELNDLREWRETYLRQQTLQLQQTQQTQESKINEDICDDNVSISSSSSSKSKNSRNSITIKNKFKIIKHKSVTAIKNVELPSLTNLLSSEFGDENDINNDICVAQGQIQGQISTRDHDDFIDALSNKLAVVKENCINLKQVVCNKNDTIGKLQFELDKKKEMIADLIEKLNDKPLPPTPMEMSKREVIQVNRYKRQSDEDKVLMNLEQQGLCPQLMNGPTPPKRSPPAIPAPKVNVVMSPSYNKGIGHNVYFSYGDENEVELKKLKENKYHNYPMSYKMDGNENKPLVGSVDNNEEDDGDGI